MEKEKIRELVAEMTLEEKAGLCSGSDFWHTKAVERLGIPAIMMSDGPFGLRKQDDKADHLGINDSIKAVCFPAGCATASSFDTDLLEELGETLGEECRAEKVGVLLGPAMNIKRSPLCGRNFEYYSEDPLLSSRLAGAYIRGLQSKGVGASPKHFYANNMEKRRMTSSSELDERTEREIYLASFEQAVREAKPWTIMCSYNRINGTYAAQNEEALTHILRDEWGFDGLVVSDWGASDDRVPDLKAGMDLEMPSSGGINDRKIVAAVQDGTLSEAVLDTACERILDIVFRAAEAQAEGCGNFDREKDHEKAAEMAKECMVLLKNDGMLPLRAGEKVAVIGKYAVKPRCQGGGSSHINSSRVESFLDAVAGMPGIFYKAGFDDASDETNEGLLAAAVKAAEEADKAVIFAGLPDLYESEGYDRDHMKLPPNQELLIREVAKVQPNTAVVLHNGSPVEMPWIREVNAVLESYLAGEAVGRAQKELLYGEANPCGRLAETFPIRLEDTPAYLNFRVEKEKVHYREGVYVGYRYYDSVKRDVLFPFGHGLSYTSFEYTGMEADRTSVTEKETVKVSVSVKNTGDMEGKEVVQIYVAPPESPVGRPAKELKGFAKVSLKPGEEKTVTVELDRRAFAYWDEQLHDWKVYRGEYQILAAASAQDICLSCSVQVQPEASAHTIYTRNTALGDIMADPEAMQKLAPILGRMKQESQPETEQSEAEQSEAGKEAITEKAQQEMMLNMPLRALASFGGVSDEQIEQILGMLNN